MSLKSNLNYWAPLQKTSIHYLLKNYWAPSCPMTYELTQKQNAQDDTEEEETASDEDDEEMALITQKFKRFMKKKWRSGKRNEGK